MRLTKKNYLLLFVFVIQLTACGTKGKYNGVITLKWNDYESRQDNINIIKIRLDRMGLTNYDIKINSETEIEIGLKYVNDTSRVINVLMMNEKLGFWECYENEEIFSSLNTLNQKLRSGVIIKDTLQRSLAEIDTAYDRQQELMNPLWSRLQYMHSINENEEPYLVPGAAVGLALDKDTAYVDSILNIGYPICFPDNLLLRWNVFRKEENKYNYLVALKKYPETGGAFMNQSSIKSSMIDENLKGQPSITIKFDEKASILWENLTRKNTGRCIAITVGDKVICYPRVESAITGGIASITGPDIEELKTIDMIILMPPYKTKPTAIKHHFEPNK